MDRLDLRILKELQQDASQSTQDIADKIGLSATPTTRRIKHLRENGYIDKQVAILNARALGFKVVAFVFIRTNQHNEKWLKTFANGINKLPEVVEFYRMSGDIDYLLKVVIADIDDYDRVYKKLIKIAPLSDVSSSFAMEEIKSTTQLPLGT